ncbi:NurA nuclease [Candidatus Moduliflexus flocculans]|uniref:NurA nuclease n=1 Tax=Candidatus Moduliflexus flocculans TaxID=1499966 RepID=A0A0S6VWR3_9BACT|nr:NurA nuclease [Candidatus Moduliflexus flocculans]
MEYEQNPFGELPEALVEEMLSKSQQLGEEVFGSFNGIQENKNIMRERLLKANILRRDSDLSYSEIPTTCGIDGSYVVDRLLATDIAACAAVAMEGLTPPSENRYWERPHHEAFMHPEKHNLETNSILRGLMMGMEIELAAKSPHDLILIDGSLTTPLIYFNQAINGLITNPQAKVGQELSTRLMTFLESYKKILQSTRSDKMWVGIPKYTTKREIGIKFEWPSSYDDRAILTNLMFPGEFLAPIPLTQPQSEWHLALPSEHTKLRQIVQEIIMGIKNIYVLYYKPNRWSPALRIEMAASIASNDSRIAIVLKGLGHQCQTPGIMEPYPLYIADQMVKSMSKAMPAFRQIAISRMTEMYHGDISEIFFSMHGYRTESGR